MYRDPQQMRRRLYEIVETFRQKSATSPEKALSREELGLPPRFEQAMHRRLGQTGIFAEINGKYYLNEDRLKQVQQEQEANRKQPPSWLRYASIIVMLPVGLIVVFLLYFIFSQTGAGTYPGEFFIVLMVIALIMFAVRMFLRQSRRKYWQQNW